MEGTQFFRRPGGVRFNPRQRARLQSVWAACAALLDYPTRELIESLDSIEQLVPGNDDLAGLIAHLRRGELRELQEQYVATFDHTRKCALYLTYFAYGDTRRRGVALVQFKQAYRRAGVEFDPSDGAEELPDHLCVVLQFGALADVEGAWKLLIDHRAGVEMLRLALLGWRNEPGTAPGSPWAGAVVALCHTLPELKGEEADAVRALIEQGPPAEEVGLQPFAMDPALAGTPLPEPVAAGPQFIGMPR